MNISYDASVDAANIDITSGEYKESIPLELDGVDLILDIDNDGRVLRLEVLAMSQLLGLIDRYGGQLEVPERIENPDAYDVMALFPKAPAHA